MTYFFVFYGMFCLLAAGKSADSFVALMMLFYFVNCEGQYLKQNASDLSSR